MIKLKEVIKAEEDLFESILENMDAIVDSHPFLVHPKSPEEFFSNCGPEDHIRFVHLLYKYRLYLYDFLESL